MHTKGGAGPGTRSSLPNATSPRPVLMSSSGFFLPSGLKGSQTQVVTRDTDPPATGTSHQARWAGMRWAGPLPGTLLSLLPTVLSGVLRIPAQTPPLQEAVPEPQPCLHAPQPPGPETRHRGHRLQASGPGGQRRGLQLTGPCPWRQGRPAVGPREA